MRAFWTLRGLSSRRSVRSLACRDRSCCFRWCGRQLSLRNMPISGVDPTPRPTAVYASNAALPRRPQDSLPSCLLGFGRTRLALASSHQLLLSHPASGSSGESFAPGDVAMDDPGFVDHPSNDAVRDSPVEEAPQMAMVSATPVLSSPDWLSVVGSWTGSQGSGSPPVCRGNGSLLLAPPFPRAGPDELGSPPSPV